MYDAFLPGDPAHKKHVGPGWVYAVFFQRIGALRGNILLKVNSIVNDFYFIFLHIEVFQNILLRFFGNSNHCIRHFYGCFFHPGGGIVPSSQLFSFPGPQRLQGMRCYYQRNAVTQFCQDTGKLGIPGMTVHYIGIHSIRIHLNTGAQCF